MVKTSDVLIILVAIIFPPAAAAFLTGCSCDLLINICLTLLGYIPGHIHAFWLIYKKMQAEERYGAGGFQYVGNGQYKPYPQAQGALIPGQAPPPNYGATQ
ncbi:uncharacterized protein ARMOST_16282 [Armillaria ostoyae]|uniref:Uncharacterized protein n=3 Tax=Armillaria TaxID=47424 RepID=A0A284RVR1_ARMOS|nr:hypothetical protein EDD85DRAFT_109734 [Armillaria nabsnona]KAK0480904.1 hypothetical protein IW261DRAFT_1607466 [Armillaria novae-zelandiae]PBK94707.1 hypothetical protein ARMGADRAFT_1011622 [Armillaria gallica]SJL12850.1 uncharacterized protein ARMOST_16282 [Armillaria ostoyae]